MKARATATVLATLTALVACTAPTEEVEPSEGAQAQSTTVTCSQARGFLELPEPGCTGARITPAEQAEIVKQWLAFHDSVYVNGSGLQGPNKPASGSLPPLPESEIDGCPCSGNWGPLVCNFYRHMPSYQTTTPNIRHCFSTLGGQLQVPDEKNPTSTRSPTYADVYDFCMYSAYEQINVRPPAAVTPVGATTAWSSTTWTASAPPRMIVTPQMAQEIAANKASGTELGVLRHLPRDFRKVFKFILFTWYQPNTFDAADQKAVIDAFWNQAYTSRSKKAPSIKPQTGAPTHGNAPQFIEVMKDKVSKRQL